MANGVSCVRVLAAGIGRLFGAALVAAALVMPFADAASAASPLCRQLERQLAAASNGAQAGARPARYARAIREQKRQLSIAQAQASRRGCSDSFLLFGGQAGDACGRRHGWDGGYGGQGWNGRQGR